MSWIEAVGGKEYKPEVVECTKVKAEKKVGDKGKADVAGPESSKREFVP